MTKAVNRVQLLLYAVLINSTLQPPYSYWRPSRWVNLKGIIGWMIRHNLYEINLEQGTAFCTACGRVKIHVAKTRTKRTPKVICINRFRQTAEAYKEKQQSKPGWKPRHVLSRIDSEKMTATCSLCGQTKIRRRIYNRATSYACATSDRAYGRKYRRSHYVARSSNPHALSQVDEPQRPHSNLWPDFSIQCRPTCTRAA